MKVAVCIPYRETSPERARNLRVVREWWAAMSTGWPVCTADSGPGPFSRSRARNQAASMLEWEVAVFCDADVVLERHDQALWAAETALRTGKYVAAHDRLRYLSDMATRRLAVGTPLETLDWLEEVRLTWESCFAVRRDLWDQVGGFDERFQGYGGQGVAFFCAAGTLGGRERIAGAAYHLDHPLVNRAAEPHFEANMRLAARYELAVGDPEAMRRVLP